MLCRQNAKIHKFPHVVSDQSICPPQFIAVRARLVKRLLREFTFLHSNVRGFSSESAEITLLVETSAFPCLVCLTETFLDCASAPALPGYALVSRLDRRDGRKCGGIILFARLGFEANLVHVGDSPTFERSFHILHTDRGAILFILSPSAHFSLKLKSFRAIAFQQLLLGI